MGGSSVASRGPGRTWHVAAVIGAVLLVAVVVVAGLGLRADTSRRAQLLLARIDKASDAVRFQPVAFLYGRMLAPADIEEHERLGRELVDRAEELVDLQPGAASDAVLVDAGRLVQETDAVVDLLDEGHVGNARVRNVTHVETAFDRLAARVAGVDRDLQRSGRRSRTESLVGAVGTIVLAGCAITLLALRHDRTRDLVISKEAVSASEERFRKLIENSSDLILVIDERFVVQDASPAAAEVLGIEAADLIGDTMVELMHPEDVERLITGTNPAEHGGVAGTVSWRCRHADGTWRHMEATYNNRLDDPAVHGIIVNARDVTPRKQLEDDLRRSQRLESVGQLAAGIAHEINTPIQFVGDNIGFLQTSFAELRELLDEYAAAVERTPAARTPGLDAVRSRIDLEFLAEEIPSALAQSREGIDQVATIVRAMKSFGHPSAEAKSSADINEALRTTLVVARNEYKYIADVHTHLQDLPPLPCHLGELNQVFLNLVVNAAHAISDRGRRPGKRGMIVVATQVQGDNVVIAVGDNGCGMPADVRERIFEPFFTTKDVGRGTGQGLALAWSTIVDRHQGSITVSSAVGEGTVFRLTLPLHPTDAAQHAEGVLA